MKKKYTFGHFLVDLFLVFLTGGLWFLWILFRAIRSK